MSIQRRSSKPGKSTSTKPVVNVWPEDAIESAIIKHGMRIADVHANKKLDLLVVMLNSRDVLRVPLSSSRLLIKASEAALNNWRLIGDGYGVHWPDLDEHLSLKGFIRDAMMSEFLRTWYPASAKPTKREKVRA